MTKSNNETQTIIQGHYTGETWGLAISDNYIITSGDDN